MNTRRELELLAAARMVLDIIGLVLDFAFQTAGPQLLITFLPMRLGLNLSLKAEVQIPVHARLNHGKRQNSANGLSNVNFFQTFEAPAIRPHSLHHDCILTRL